MSTLDLTAKLLVATPMLDDPNFHRTVLFLVAHGEMGALGLVLNRPSEGEVDEILPEWGAVAAPPAFVFVGGPVSLDSVIGLGWMDSEPDADGPFTSVLGPVGTVDLHRPPTDAGGDLRAARLFAGSAGWAPDQLENEIAEGSWFVVGAQPEDVFTPEPDDLWRAVLRRQPGKLAWYANAVGDTRLN
jgi:putative transcriptional regulator